LSALFINDVVLPKPEEILGDLNGAEILPPDDIDYVPVDPTIPKKPCLRETKAHEELIYHFTKCVVTTSTFNSNSGKHLLEKYLWPSLESFLVVAYTNNYETWMEEIERKQEQENQRKRKARDGEDEEDVNDRDEVDKDSSSSDDDVVTPNSSAKKFTRKRGSGKYNGWSQEAIRLYNRVYEVLKVQRKDRTDDVLKYFDDNMKKRFTSKNSSKMMPNRGVEQDRAASDEMEYYRRNKENETPVVPI
jgi:hypothetical protein